MFIRTTPLLPILASPCHQNPFFKIHLDVIQKPTESKYYVITKFHKLCDFNYSLTTKKKKNQT